MEHVGPRPNPVPPPTCRWTFPFGSKPFSCVSGASAAAFGWARLVYLLVAGSILLLFGTPAAAQAVLAPGAESNEAAPPIDPFGRGTPRGLATGLISALGSEDYERAAQYFELSGVRQSRREARGVDLARQLNSLLDAGGSMVPFLALSSDSAGDIDDRLPLNQERIGSLPSEEGDIPIIAVASEEEGQTIWRISWQTLAAMPPVSETADSGTLRDSLPAWASDVRLAGAPVVDWLILIIAAALLYVVVRVAFRLLLFLLCGWTSTNPSSRTVRFAEAAAPPLSLWIAVMAFLAVTRDLQVAIVARQILTRFAGAVALVAFAWFLWRVLDLVSRLTSESMDRRNRRRAKAAIVFFRRAAKLTLLAIAAVVTLDSFGLDVTAGVAALGLGGLALALGAQRTVENFVGSISVLVDEPVRVGDFCKVGDVVGTVEDIGIRSTRIRTNDRTVVTIPNGSFSALQIENFAKRDRFLFNPVLNLARDLDADGVERVLAGVRAALAESGVVQQGGRANLADFGLGSIDIEIFAYVETHDFDEFVMLRERLLLDIMRRIERAGGRLASPARSIQLEPSEALDAVLTDCRAH